MEEIHHFDTSWKLVSKSFSSEPTVIRLARRAVGGGGVLVMAGSCAVDGWREIVEIAQAVA